MSPKEYVKSGAGKKQLTKAVRQQKQLQYLTVSEIQPDSNDAYIKSLTSGKYSGTDPLLAWVYMLFKKDNFKSFAKYLRFPVSSSRICKEEIEKALKRVFFSDDAFKKRIVNNKEIEAPDFLNEDSFAEEAFDAVLYRHNDIYVHNMESVNLPYRELLEIKDVQAITLKGNTIHKIAYKAKLPINERLVDGFVYLDAERFAFVPKDQNTAVIEVPHDIKRCPASFVAGSPFSSAEPIVRESIFTRVRPLLEEYVFLTTLRLMSDANGAFPIVVKLAAQAMDAANNDQEDSSVPMSAASAEGHKEKKPVNELQAGSVITVPAIEKQDGSIDTDLAKNFINFFRTPVESLEYIDKRIHGLRKQIVETVVGDFVEQSEDAKNELQISKSYIAKQDKLRALAKNLAYCIGHSDEIMLKLAFGANVQVDCSYGTDFFIETQDDLFKQFNAAPNPIEKNNVLQRLSRIRGHNNNDRANRDALLYKLVPYISNADFDKALGLRIVSPHDILLQTRFNYFITIFESTYGDIVEFWDAMEGVIDNQKLIFINNLLIEIIKDYEYEQQEEKPAETGED